MGPTLKAGKGVWERTAKCPMICGLQRQGLGINPWADQLQACGHDKKQESEKPTRSTSRTSTCALLRARHGGQSLGQICGQAARRPGGQAGNVCEDVQTSTTTSSSISACNPVSAGETEMENAYKDGVRSITADEMR